MALNHTSLCAAFRLTIACALVGLLLLVRPAYAETIYENLNTPQVGVTASSNGWSAQSFVVGPNRMKLESVDLRILPLTATGDFVVRLFANNSSLNQPGTQMETLSGPLNPGPSQPHYLSLANTVLEANSPYWIVVSSTGTAYSVGAEGGFIVPVGSNIGSKWSPNAGSTWEPMNWSLNMQVSGVQFVPEPSSIAIAAVGFGVVLLGAGRRWRRLR